jgi:hypothetical protein
MELEELDSIVNKGKNAAKVIVLILILLLSDLSPEGRGKKTKHEISQILNISERTIETAKKRFTEEGISLALKRKPKKVNPTDIKFAGAFEAMLVALAALPPPERQSQMDSTSPDR